jgi:NhaP-type Na+/H+ and K+/H+ antiporter
VTFGVVIVSLLLQGWTISPFAWLVGFGNRLRAPV